MNLFCMLYCRTEWNISKTIEQLTTVNSSLRTLWMQLDCSRLLALRWGSRATLLSSGQTEVQNLDLRHRGLLSCRPGEKIWLFIWPTVNTKAWLHNLGDKSDSSVGVLTFKSWFVLGELLSGSKGFDLRRRIKLPSGRRTLTFQNTSLTESFETEKIKAVCCLLDTSRR